MVFARYILSNILPSLLSRYVMQKYEFPDLAIEQAENIKFTLEQQMVFFARLIGHFNVADPITPIKIDNFD